MAQAYDAVVIGPDAVAHDGDVVAVLVRMYRRTRPIVVRNRGTRTTVASAVELVEPVATADLAGAIDWVAAPLSV